MSKTAIQQEIKDKKHSLRKEKLEHSKPVVAFKNGTRLVEVTALAIVAGYALYRTWPSLHEVTAGSVVILTAGVIIALRASYEFFSYLSKDV